MKRYELFQFKSAGELARTAAEEWMERVAESKRQGKEHLVAVSGGRIARDLFSAMAKLGKEHPGLLSKVHFFWADERCVPLGSSESNFLIAKELLLDPLGVPDSNVHRIRGEGEPEGAAQQASAELNRIAGQRDLGQPILDLVFLGMGEDGHVASLFPDAPAEVVKDHAPYLPVIGPKPPPKRVTLSYATLLAAREVWVLVSGEAKKRPLKEALSGEGKQTPMARILKDRSSTRVFTDTDLGL